MATKVLLPGGVARNRNIREVQEGKIPGAPEPALVGVDEAAEPFRALAESTRIITRTLTGSARDVIESEVEIELEENKKRLNSDKNLAESSFQQGLNDLIVEFENNTDWRNVPGDFAARVNTLRLDTIAGVVDDDVREDVGISTDGKAQQALFNMNRKADGHERDEQFVNHKKNLTGLAQSFQLANSNGERAAIRLDQAAVTATALKFGTISDAEAVLESDAWIQESTKLVARKMIRPPADLLVAILRIKDLDDDGLFGMDPDVREDFVDKILVEGRRRTRETRENKLESGNRHGVEVQRRIHFGDDPERGTTAITEDEIIDDLDKFSSIPAGLAAQERLIRKNLGEDTERPDWNVIRMLEIGIQNRTITGFEGLEQWYGKGLPTTIASGMLVTIEALKIPEKRAAEMMWIEHLRTSRAAIEGGDGQSPPGPFQQLRYEQYLQFAYAWREKHKDKDFVNDLLKGDGPFSLEQFVKHFKVTSLEVISQAKFDFEELKSLAEERGRIRHAVFTRDFIGVGEETERARERGEDIVRKLIRREILDPISDEQEALDAWERDQLSFGDTSVLIGEQAVRIVEGEAPPLPDRLTFGDVLRRNRILPRRFQIFFDPIPLDAGLIGLTPGLSIDEKMAATMTLGEIGEMEAKLEGLGLPSIIENIDIKKARIDELREQQGLAPLNAPSVEELLLEVELEDIATRAARKARAAAN